MNLRPSYYAIDHFPTLKPLAANWYKIREEFKELSEVVMDIHRFEKGHEEVLEEMESHVAKGKPFGWLIGWGKDGPNPDWIQYPLVAYDQAIPYVAPKMQYTLQMLDKIKGIKVCALVKMKSHCFLPCHQHPEIFEEGLLQMHIPIDTARERNYAYLNVEGEFRQHNCGEPIIFDGSLDHFAINTSEKDRTILYMEFFKEELMQ